MLAHINMYINLICKDAFYQDWSPKPPWQPGNNCNLSTSYITTVGGIKWVSHSFL